MEKFKAEWQELVAQKKAPYTEYRAVKEEMWEILTVKANIDGLPGLSVRQKNKEPER